MARLPQKKHAPASLSSIVGDHRDRHQHLAKTAQSRHKAALVLMLALIVGAGTIQAVPQPDQSDPIETQLATVQDVPHHSTYQPIVLDQNTLAAAPRLPTVTPPSVSGSATSPTGTAEPSSADLPAAEVPNDTAMAILAAVPHAR